MPFIQRARPCADQFVYVSWPNTQPHVPGNRPAATLECFFMTSGAASHLRTSLFTLRAVCAWAVVGVNDLNGAWHYMADDSLCP